jgi:hypothetical protein
VFPEGSQVGSACNEVDVDPGLSQPATEIAPDPSRAVDSDPHLLTTFPAAAAAISGA